eukprot:6476601-Amphidinium_carterae.1
MHCIDIPSSTRYQVEFRDRETNGPVFAGGHRGHPYLHPLRLRCVPLATATSSRYCLNGMCQWNFLTLHVTYSNLVTGEIEQMQMNASAAKRCTLPAERSNLSGIDLISNVSVDVLIYGRDCFLQQLFRRSCWMVMELHAEDVGNTHKMPLLQTLPLCQQRTLHVQHKGIILEHAGELSGFSKKLAWFAWLNIACPYQHSDES